MNFLYPSFLFALFALVIPVIIHLFQFRRFRTVYFSNVRFLKEVKEETSSRSNIKHWLVLLTRILALTFLVFAFAQPFIPNKSANVVQGQKAVSVYIDNSFSMDARSVKIDLLEQAKTKAVEIANGYSETDLFQLLTNDFEGRHQRLVNREIFINNTREVQISPEVKTLEQVRKRQMQVLEGSLNPVAYMISDFQQNICDLVEDTLLPVFLVPLKSVTVNNIAIDSAWMTSPVQLLGQTASVVVRITNYGDQDIENSNLSLMIDEERKAISDFSVAAGTFILDTLNFTITTEGWNECKITISDYPITFDDSYYFTFNALNTLEILSINQNGENEFIKGLGQIGIFNMANQSAGSVNYSDFMQYKLIILNQVNTISTGMAVELDKFVRNGGHLLVFPGPDMDFESYRRFLLSIESGSYEALIDKQQSITEINIDEGLFADVFSDLPKNLALPVVNKFFRIKKQTRSGEETIIAMQDGNAFLSKYEYGKGASYLCTVPSDLEYSDFPRHTLFVLTIARLALTGENDLPISFIIGKDNLVEVQQERENIEQQYKIKSITNSGIDFIPPQTPLGNKMVISFSMNEGGGYDQLNEAGIYRLYLPGSDFEQMLAFNYDRKESEIKQYPPDELENLFPYASVSVIDNTNTNLSSIVNTINEGTSLWKLCIIFALIFLGVEVLLLRFLPD
jgi:Aerotolerance regulator N-terminal